MSKRGVDNTCLTDPIFNEEDEPEEVRYYTHIKFHTQFSKTTLFSYQFTSFLPGLHDYLANKILQSADAIA